MPIENATHIAGLVEANPAGSETLSEGDDHLRLTKFCVRNTLPNFNTTVTITSTQLNTFPTDIQTNKDAIVALDGKVDANYTDLQGQISVGDSNTYDAATAFATNADLFTLGNANQYTDDKIDDEVYPKMATDIAALANGQVATNTANIATNTVSITELDADINGPGGVTDRLTSIETAIDDINAGDTDYDAAKQYTDSVVSNLINTRINPIESKNAVQDSNIASNLSRIISLEAAGGGGGGDGITEAQVNTMINTALSNLLEQLFPRESYYIGSALMRNSATPAFNLLPGNWVEADGDYTHATTNDGDDIVNVAPFFGTFDNNGKYLKIATSPTGVAANQNATRQRWRIWYRTS